MPVFEVAIYNQAVLDCVNEGEHHKHLSDDWSDTHYVEVEAGSEAEARRKITPKYPEAQGFVITSVTPA